MGQAKLKKERLKRYQSTPHKKIGLLEDEGPGHCFFYEAVTQNQYKPVIFLGDESSIKLALKKLKV